jgi:hypothetical protein
MKNGNHGNMVMERRPAPRVPHAGGREAALTHPAGAR